MARSVRLRVRVSMCQCVSVCENWPRRDTADTAVRHATSFRQQKGKQRKIRTDYTRRNVFVVAVVIVAIE